MASRSTSGGPTPHSELSFPSGSLCFGAMHNIWHGATSPRTGGFPLAAPERSGTIRVQNVPYNLPTAAGTWKAYRLRDQRDRKVTVGWLVCHSSVPDPVAEAQRILRISGSPYESDTGSNFNDEQTVAQGIFVVNRYDWGYHKNDGKDEAEDQDEDATFHTMGLTDYGQAKVAVQAWQKVPSHKRKPTETSVWLFVDEAEYLFGRFGFDENRTAVTSFLHFSSDTEFDNTVVEGTQEPLRDDSS